MYQAVTATGGPLADAVTAIVWAPELHSCSHQEEEESYIH
jgi:hypothetical protein